MRFTTLTCCIVLLLGSSVALSKTGVTGKWTAQTLMGPGGAETPVATTFTFTVKGAEVTGSVSNSRGTFEIQDGKVDGDSIVFNILAANRIKILYDGKITAEGIDFITKFEGRDDRSDHFIAKRLPE